MRITAEAGNRTSTLRVWIAPCGRQKDHLIWIWMGEPALADPSIIVDSPEHNDQAWTWRPYNFPVKAN
ncbi:MAG: hypothetical protein ACSLE1_02665, partial [Sphingobium sp.]